MKKNLFIYLIIFLEGVVVLSVEMLAIRLTTPFVGSGTDTIAIIISAVLVPLALGYYYGGKFRADGAGKIRTKLQNNFFISLVILSIGLAYGILAPGFEFLNEYAGIKNRFVLMGLYAGIFIVIPVYFLGQTIPLSANYFKRSNLAETTGRVLFFSTIGSFVGATATTILLMNWVGVPYTAFFTLLCIFILILLLSNKRNRLYVACALPVLLFGFIINSPVFLNARNLVASNNYSFVQVFEHGKNETVRMIKINGAFSSSILPKDGSLPMRYADYIEKNFIRPMQRMGPESEILILGAGGFTLGQTNKVNPITYVDIDPQLKKIAEEDFLQKPLGENITFISKPARSFLSENDKKYDLVIIDLGKGLTGSPEHLLTQEFYKQVKNSLGSDGIMLAHYYVSTLMDDVFSRRLDNTINSVFPNASRTIVENFNPWTHEYKSLSSVIYIYKNREPETGFIYTDMLNRSAMDKNKKLNY